MSKILDEESAEICAMKIGTIGSTHGETNDSTPAENARNGPAGPFRLKLELERGPTANATTGMSANTPKMMYSVLRDATG